MGTDTERVIPDFEVDVFETSLHDPDSEDSVQLWVGQCLRERIPAWEIVEHPDRGEMIRKSGYASWCEPDNDLEVTVSGAEHYVDRVVDTLTLTRSSSVEKRAAGAVYLMTKRCSVEAVISS